MVVLVSNSRAQVVYLGRTRPMATGGGNPAKKKPAKKAGSGAAPGPILDIVEWEKIPDMPTKRCFATGAYHERKLYVLGRSCWVGHDSFSASYPVCCSC